MKTALSLFVVFIFWATSANGQAIIKGSGYILTQQREISTYNSIEVNGTFRVFISPDELRPVVVEADNNLFAYIKTEVKDNTLIIYIEDSVYIKKFAAMNIFLSTPHIVKIKVASGASLDGSPHPWKNLRTDIEVVDDSQIKWHPATQLLNIAGRNNADIILKGSTGQLNVELELKSTLEASGLKTQEADIHLSTQSEATIEVSGKIKYNLQQKSRLIYKGEPKITEALTTSGARVIRKK